MSHCGISPFEDNGEGLCVHCGGLPASHPDRQLAQLVNEAYLGADRRRHWLRENGRLNWPDGTRSPRPGPLVDFGPEPPEPPERGTDKPTDQPDRLRKWSWTDRLREEAQTLADSVERLQDEVAEVEAQRDALADALEPLLRVLGKVQDWSTTHVGDAMEACEEALRKAGR